MCPSTILLVDDNDSFLHLASQYLLLDPCLQIIGTAHNGLEALHQIEISQPDVLIIDLHMPVLSGLETIPRVKKQFPKIKIIALTILDAEYYQPAALSAGANEFVSKNALLSDLFPAIQRVMQKVE
jgi:DNA-binding NarL/FixJ family response regulator